MLAAQAENSDPSYIRIAGIPGKETAEFVRNSTGFTTAQSMG